MVRTQETCFAEFEEFEDMEGGNPMWRILPKRMKMRSEHLVPPPRQATDKSMTAQTMPTKRRWWARSR